MLNNFLAQENCPKARIQYLEENPDVKKVNIDPWAHYINYGKKEGRVWPSCQEIIYVSKVTNDNDITYGTLNDDGFLVNEKGFGGLRAFLGMDQTDSQFDDTLQFNIEKLILLQKAKDSLKLLLNKYEYKSFTYTSNKYPYQSWSGINDDVIRTYNILKASDLYWVPESYYHKLSWLAYVILDGKKYHKSWKEYDGNNSNIIIGFNSQEKYFFKPLYNQNIFGMENEIRIDYNFLPGEHTLSKEYVVREFDIPQCLKCSNGVFLLYKTYSVDYLNYRNKFFSKIPKVDCETCRMISEEEKNAFIKQITNLDSKYFDLKQEYDNLVKEFSSLEKSFVWKINNDYYYVGHLDNSQKPFGYGKLIGPNNKIIFSGMWENGFPKQIGNYFLYTEFGFPHLILMSQDNKIVFQIFSGSELNTNSTAINLYLGEFSNGNRNGYGQGFHLKSKYVGNWKNGLLDGKGEIYFHENGNTYKGDLSNCKYQGFGEYFSGKSKTTFKANWVDNKANGYGELYSSNGTLIEKGNYINGELQPLPEISQVNQNTNYTNNPGLVSCSFQFSKPKLKITWVDNRKSCCNYTCKNYAVYTNKKSENLLIQEQVYLTNILEAHFLECDADENHKNSDRARLNKYITENYYKSSNPLEAMLGMTQSLALSSGMAYQLTSRFESSLGISKTKSQRIQELKSTNFELNLYETSKYCSDKCKNISTYYGYKCN